VITCLAITNAGSDYFTTPTITITSGITSTTSIVGGSGYINGNFPLIVSGGGGSASGCTGAFTISGGGLTSITILNAGRGYTSAPTLSFTNANSGSGTGASATATLGTGASAIAVVGTGAAVVHRLLLVVIL
jgi:hypothetical protein